MNVNVGLKVAKYKAMIRNIDNEGKNTYIPYPITEGEYAKIKIAIANKEPFIWIHDIDGNALIEVNPKNDIKRFIPITQEKGAFGLNILCDFGVSHPVHNGSRNCECSKKYGCLGISFLKKLNESLGLDVLEKSRITDEMRIKYLNNLNKG